VTGKDLQCKPMKIDWTFYCHKCDGMASLRTCPHTKDDRVILSGTKLRKALSEGAEVVDHFGREEVLVHLREYYQGLTEKVEVKMQGAASGMEEAAFFMFSSILSLFFLSGMRSLLLSEWTNFLTSWSYALALVKRIAK
jgi:hypothetical protein